MSKTGMILVSMVLVLTLTPQVFGQGCAMCLTSAMSQGPNAAAALNNGVMVLLVPPFLMLVGIFGFTLRRHATERRNRVGISREP